ncbi:hypothetical protein HCN51_13810 [Nonomuraea sp. FMUSA5-5]|uniref:GNAT family N-acetyltransferase n=2 Tax=Nonomuraea composti TaxID=2720023 RepID=A0ABX1B205_9ACTN|nr:hypothetical protein [Nonomuraea sp. FMUSA5-5]NJP90517.1 hypothetical protein [Nonomuraea sp. FMUSA5-5]
MPFGVPWTDAPAAELPTNVALYHLGVMSRWRPDAWCCDFVVVHEGRVIGSQDVKGTGFAVTREVRTGSWLGRAHQGKGFGTEMRAAVLRLDRDDFDCPVPVEIHGLEPCLPHFGLA